MKVNKTKNAVDKVEKRKFLGFTITHFVEIFISKAALKRIKNKIRVITSRNRGISLATMIREFNQVIRGWFIILNVLIFIRS